MRNDYINKADAVITTSDILFHSKSCKTKECYLIKNGVDFNRFCIHADKPKNTKKKVVGYTGSIDDRFDIGTMIYLIENLPDVEFLLPEELQMKMHCVFCPDFQIHDGWELKT